MKKIAMLAAVAALALTVSAQAQQHAVTFQFEGDTWTITNSADGAGVSAIRMTPGFKAACPQLRIKLEASKLGPQMSKEQRFRGDKRWHVVCDRSAPPAATQTIPQPPVAQPPAPPRATQEPANILVRS